MQTMGAFRGLPDEFAYIIGAFYGTAFVYAIGPGAIGTFAVNEAKDEALSYITYGASDYIYLTKGLWKLGKKGWKKLVEDGLEKGVLSGQRTTIGDNLDEATKRSLIRENESADILTEKGFNVEQNPVTSGTKNPDYKINGKIYDNYSPETSNVRNIWSNVKDKVDSGQTNRVVLNLTDFKGDASKLKEQFESYEIEGLEDVIFISK